MMENRNGLIVDTELFAGDWNGRARRGLGDGWSDSGARSG